MCASTEHTGLLFLKSIWEQFRNFESTRKNNYVLRALVDIAFPARTGNGPIQKLPLCSQRTVYLADQVGPGYIAANSKLCGDVIENCHFWKGGEPSGGSQVGVDVPQPGENGGVNDVDQRLRITTDSCRVKMLARLLNRNGNWFGWEEMASGC